MTLTEQHSGVTLEAFDHCLYGLERTVADMLTEYLASTVLGTHKKSAEPAIFFVLGDHDVSLHVSGASDLWKCATYRRTLHARYRTGDDSCRGRCL